MTNFYFYPVFLEDKRLNTNDVLILSYVISWSSKREYFAIEFLAAKLNLNKTTISNILKKLVDLNYLSRKKPKYKKYYLTKITENTKIILKEYYNNYIESASNEARVYNTREEAVDEINTLNLMELFKKVVYEKN